MKCTYLQFMKNIDDFELRVKHFCTNPMPSALYIPVEHRLSELVLNLFLLKLNKHL